MLCAGIYFAFFAVYRGTYAEPQPIPEPRREEPCVRTFCIVAV